MPTFLTSPAKLVLIALLILTGCAAACKRDGNHTAVANPAAPEAVKAQFDILRDSVDAKWRVMTGSDDQKISVTRLLLRELKTQPGLDAARLQALDQANARLKTTRYTQQSMTDSGLIDRYDAAQDSLLNALYSVAAPNGNAPTENTRNFVEGIQQIDAGVVAYRVQYDHAAQQYNAYLRLHQAELQQLGGQHAQLKPLPLFTIGAK